MWGDFLFLLIPFLFLSPINSSYSIPQKIICEAASSLYIKNIFVYGGDRIEFFLPSTVKFKYLHPFSLISPSGKQLISIIPQDVDITSNRIVINFYRALEEKGQYQITFTGVDEITNTQIDLTGRFTYN